MRPTVGRVCRALAEALAWHGTPEQVFTDNGKVFTARFRPLTALRSPTTMGKVERLH